MVDTLLLEVILVMTHVKNLQPTRVLEESISPIKKQNNIFPSFQHLRILGSTIYIFFHEE